YQSKDFRLDASSETLLIEGDPDLKYLNEINEKFGAKEFLVLTLTPKEKITSEKTINNILSLKYKIQSLNWVHNVITILDIPLLDSSDEPLMDRIKNFRTLKDENIDRDRGFKEILNSPVFRNFVISEDAKTTGIIVNLKEREKPQFSALDNKKEIENYKDSLKKERHQNIIEIREIIKSFEDVGKIHLGGIPMIADDMMTFIKNDIIVFGFGVFLFIVFTLWYVFRKLIWIFIPISSCFFSVLIMSGFLGIMNWKVTVISSNFIALMLILTMAMNIHMSTRFLQLRKEFPNLSLFEIITLTTEKMVWPIIYTVLTTMCAFLSLIFSEIKPIIDFGLMMSFGLLTSFIVTFSLLPTLLNIFDYQKVEVEEKSFSSFTNALSKYSINNVKLILSISIILIILSIFGISKLKVENSFINYFSKDTEIYKGMKLIDEKLGGTTPLNIILKFDNEDIEVVSEDEDQFEDWDEESNEEDKSKYWFTKDKIDRIRNVHLYLEKLDYVGKVLSFYSIIEIATKLNNDKELGTLEMGVLYSKLPETIKKEIVDPYISVKNNEARINLRIKDSSENLRRNQLINKINSELKSVIGLKDESFKLGGVLILFNNLLQSLFKSQILTLGLVMLGIFLMFLILFRNIKISLIGVIPNFIAAFAILGLIGLLNIPLDMMTITIAAITIGIAVDNSIHYIYRFIEEYKKNNNYNEVINTCHSTVGIAILNTSITIVFGFSILILSNFIPTIYFGIFTGIAMLLAMILVLTLLPSLIILIKPFGIKIND
ncbi:MMPL family transporter, partial [Candidatus Pelagibacter sp.]|nr:MMPL family transporter [Candidatus Pelagibacter sp.]